MKYKITAALVAFAVILIAFTQFNAAYFALITVVTLTWLMLSIYAIHTLSRTPSARALLRALRGKLDHNLQCQKDGATLDDRIVLELFNELDTAIKKLLDSRKTRLYRLKRDLSRFMQPAQSNSFEWHPTSLIEMGFLIHIRKHYRKGAPVLAIYRFSGQTLDRDGVLITTFKLIGGHSSIAFPLAIKTETQPLKPITPYNPIHI